MKYERFYELMTRGLEAHMNIAHNQINKNVRFFYDFFNDEDIVRKLSVAYQTGITTGGYVGEVRMSNITKDELKNFKNPSFLK